MLNFYYIVYQEAPRYPLIPEGIYVQLDKA